MASITTEPGKVQEVTVSGRVLLEIREGQLFLFPVASSDEEARRLLEAVSTRIRCGDLAELVAA